MVNTGKPSRGCYTCRARRIKCDEGKPGCMRCQKSKRVCPGYRDEFELKLRDESKATKKKQQQRRQTSISGLSYSHAAVPVSADGFPMGFPSSQSPNAMVHSRNRSPSNVMFGDAISEGSLAAVHKHHNLMAGHMTTPLHQQASCYFLANFVLVPQAGTMRGYLDFVLPLLTQKNPPQSLVLAFSAVTLAALGTRPNSKALLPTADLWYLKALKEINQTLQDPKLASSDSALASVMMMSVFEQLTPSRMMVRGWGSHIDGAVAVMKSRKAEQWQTPVGKELFIAVRAHMTLHSIANAKAQKTGIDWLAVVAHDDVTQSFGILNLKMARIRAQQDGITSLRTHNAENIAIVQELLGRAQALDVEYADWIKTLPEPWAIKTVAWIDGEIPDLANSIIHPGRVDAYGELWMVYKYNVVRACRIFLWTAILRCIAWLGNYSDYRLTPEYTTATSICRQLVEDIVASVPYFFGWQRGQDPDMADVSNFACGNNDTTTVKPLAGIFSMWPLFAAASSDFASPSQRMFLRGRLAVIADIMGINQAKIMLQVHFTHPSTYIGRERMGFLPPTNYPTGTPPPVIPVVAAPPPPPPVVQRPPPVRGHRRAWSTGASVASSTMWVAPLQQGSTDDYIPRTFTETSFLHSRGPSVDQHQAMRFNRNSQTYNPSGHESIPGASY